MKGKIFFFIIGVIILTITLLVGGRVPYFILYSFLAAILLPAFHGLLGKWKLTGEIILPEKELMAGEETTIKYIFKNHLPFSFPYIEFQNDIVYRLTGKKEKNKLFHLYYKEEYWGETTVSCKRRGYYTLGEAKLIIKDIFNLFNFHKKIKAPMSLKVYPRIVPLSYFSIQASLQMGDLIVKEPIFQDYSSLKDLKIYREGDSVKRVHWKASAKQDKLYVKNFELRGDTEVVILMNNCLEDYKEDKERWIEDLGVEVVISVIDYCLNKNMGISLIQEKADNTAVLKGDSRMYMKAFLEAMVTFQPSSNIDFCYQIDKVASTLRQGTTLLIVTPNLSKRVGTLGIELKMRNISPVFIIIGDEKMSPLKWNENKEIAKKLQAEGIAHYIINGGQHIQDALEGKHEKGA